MTATGDQLRIAYKNPVRLATTANHGLTLYLNSETEAPHGLGAQVVLVAVVIEWSGGVCEAVGGGLRARAGLAGLCGGDEWGDGFCDDAGICEEE